MKYLFCLLLLTACNVQYNVELQLDEANYCEVANDCISIGQKCPFGCNILVNKEEADIMQRKLNALPDTRCTYDCIKISEIVCEENKCKGIE